MKEIYLTLKAPLFFKTDCREVDYCLCLIWIWRRFYSIRHPPWETRPLSYITVDESVSFSRKKESVWPSTQKAARHLGYALFLFFFFVLRRTQTWVLPTLDCTLHGVSLLGFIWLGLFWKYYVKESEKTCCNWGWTLS